MGKDIENNQSNNIASIKDFAARFLEFAKKRITKELYDILNKHIAQEYSQYFITTAAVFNNQLSYLFKDSVSGVDYRKVVDSLEEINESSKKNLMSSYEKYYKFYKDELDIFNSSPSEVTISSLISHIRIKSLSLK